LTSKTYYLKTSDAVLQQLMDSVDNKSKYLEDAANHFSKCDVRDTEKQLKLEGARLQNLKTTLQIFKMTKEEKIKDPLKVVKGEIKLSPPELPTELKEVETMQEGKVDRNCMCGHVHVDTIPHVCSEKTCLCGIRG